MRWTTIIFAAASVVMASCAADEPSKGGDRTKDISEIKSNAEAYEQAYNSRNAEKVASFWAENAVYTTPGDGNEIKGRKAIADHFKQFFEGGEVPKIDVAVDDISFDGPDKAIEKGHITFKDVDGSEDGSAYQAHSIKENGRWVLQSVKEVETGIAPSHYEHLKELNWLAGSWKDTDENSDVELHFKWGKNNNYLVEHFTVKVLGKEEIEGIQIIGWDAHQKKIRSWVFDSDGGFRQGTWSKSGDQWVAAMSTTMHDGRTATSLDLYSKVDDTNFNFSMDSIDVDGEMQPNIGPIKFVKGK